MSWFVFQAFERMLPKNPSLVLWHIELWYTKQW
jgi:hypothetical protein